MKALQKLLDTRKKGLVSFEFEGEKYLVRKLSPNDYTDALIYAKNVSINQSAILSDGLRNLPPDKGLIAMYEGQDVESLKVFGLDKPSNLFEQQAGIRTLMAFIGYQYSNIVMDKDGKRLYNSPGDREELAMFISDNEEFRNKIAESLLVYAESEKTDE